MPPESSGKRGRASSSAIFAALTQAIERGDLRPGDRLPTERALAAQHGAARNTVRRALDRLEAADLVTRHVGRGTFVGPGERAAEAEGGPSPATRIAHAMELLLLLEPACIELAATRGLAEGGRLQPAQLPEATPQGKRALFDLELAFHRRLAAAARNAAIAEVMERFAALFDDRTVWDVVRSHLSAAHHQRFQQERFAIDQALGASDIENAKARATNHLLHLRWTLLEY